MSQEIIINATDITKSYKLYDSHSDRVRETFHPFRKKYHNVFNALNNVSLQVKRGETVGIIGRNGSGKSTLLQIVAGILQPTLGRISVNGRISALLELGAGFNPEFTGRQNVYINAAILGLTNDEIDARFSEIAAFADIGDFIDQPVKTYSSGMYVRLAFAIAISVNPDILIVDEALAVGDAYFQAKCFAKFREFQKMGITILFVTHALDMITSYCSSAYLLEQGSVYASGSPKDVVDEYNRLIVDCARRSPKEPASMDSAPGLKSPDKDLEMTRGKQWEGLFQLNPNENRYGDGKAEIIEAGIFTVEGEAVQALIKGEMYEFRIKTRFHSTIQNPIFAYTIKDVKGFDLSGTNTYFQDIDTGTVHEGEFILSKFTHMMNLNPGEYLLSFGCAGHEDGKYVVYERRYDHLKFNVVSDQMRVGIFDLNSEISIYHL